MNDAVVIISLVIFGTLILGTPIIDAQIQQIRQVNDLHQKFVVTFESARILSDVCASINTEIIPLIDTAITERFTVKMTSLSITKEYKCSQQDLGLFEFYPDITIYGRTSLTDEELKTEMDGLTSDIESVIKLSPFNIEMTNELYHIDKSTGVIVK